MKRLNNKTSNDIIIDLSANKFAHVKKEFKRPDKQALRYHRWVMKQFKKLMKIK